MDYLLLDAGHFRKLERVGKELMIRPAPSAIFPPRTSWQDVNLEFERYSEGKGEWKGSAKERGWPQTLSLGNLRNGPIKMIVKPTSFGHLGVFFETCKSWEFFESAVSRISEKLSHKNSESHQKVEVLNLFAYTGAASIVCALAGAHVTHVDSSKTSVQWAKENAALNGSAQNSIRWIVEDVQKFISREKRRGRKYQGVIMDPPTYGRGSENEIWKIEDHLLPLIESVFELLDPEIGFLFLSSHSPGYTPFALKEMLYKGRKWEGSLLAEEMTVPAQSGLVLPSGAMVFGTYGLTDSILE